MAQAQPLITRYRPESFAEVFGHGEILKALQRVLTTDTHPHAFLLIGPSGVGKTSIARLIAKTLNAEVLEIDAASNNGVDAMRELVDIGAHNPLFGAGKRCIIIDEVHVLTKPAWQTLLKILEEPPAHLYIALCTTEAHKVPETIETRCFPITLRSLRPGEIEDLLIAVSAAEEWPLPSLILANLIQYAAGSPRRALSGLQAVQGIDTQDEIQRVLMLLEASSPLANIIQTLLRINHKEVWPRIKQQLVRMDEADSESALPQMVRYLSKLMLSAENEADSTKAWEILECLIQPTQTPDPKAALIAAIGRWLWGLPRG